MMWYGVLGTRELLHRTYKNLEQKVLLEVSRGPCRPLLHPRPRPWASGWEEAPADGCVSLPSLCCVSAASVTDDPSHSPVSRELLSSTFPAMPEGPTSGGAPRKTMYVSGCWVVWA